MKLKFATKVFIASNLTVIILRTLQIIFLTESATKFLKPNLLFLSVVGSVLGALFIIYNALNSFIARRRPYSVNFDGLPTAISVAATGFMFSCYGGFLYTNAGFAYEIKLILTLLCGLFTLLYAAQAIFEYKVPKVAPLFFIALYLLEFASAYIYCSEHPLRVQNVLEILTICSVLLFALSFGKLMSGVEKTKNARILYPLGLTSATLCFASVVPPFLATLFGLSEFVTPSSLSHLMLMGSGIFITAITLNTFKKSNTFLP